MKLIHSLIKVPFLRRLIPSLVRRAMFLFKVYKINYKFNNLDLHLDLRDAIDRYIFFHNYYEKEQVAYLLNHIEKNKVTSFIDIGSNIGIYSLILAKHLIDLKIYSFEPHFKAFERFKKNSEMNNFENRISISNIGISDNEGLLYIDSPQNLGIDQSGGASLSQSGINKVKVNTLDNELDLKNEHLAIKIDVEGHEDKVIEGGVNLFKNNYVFMQIEIFDKNYKNILPLLTKSGFKLIKKIDQKTANAGDYFFEKKL